MKKALFVGFMTSAVCFGISLGILIEKKGGKR